MIITCVHQGYELYGSDRSFVETVEALHSFYPEATIDVVLPRHGPIVAALEPFATRIEFEPLWVLRRRNLTRLATLGLLSLPAAIRRALVRFRRSDLVYINTSVVVDYALASRFHSCRAIIHVHEIPNGSTLCLLRALMRFSRASLIFNSQATRRAFDGIGGGLSRVIYNGLAGPTATEAFAYDGTRPLRVLMLGRYNRIKGQEVLIQALRLLPAGSRPQVKMVGGAFEDKAREGMLRALVDAGGLGAHVELLPFVADPSVLYRWADVVAVPSRLPESLGRVAIEAMAYGRPPLASKIGGLPEVVEHGVTGWLIEPDSASALAATLRTILEAPEAWTSFAAAGRARFAAVFSAQAFATALRAMVQDVVTRGCRAHPAPRSAPHSERSA